MHFYVSVAVAIACGLTPWAAARLPARLAAAIATPLLVVMVVGAATGLPLYPYSDVVVGAFSVLAGIAIGRALPPRFRPLLVLMLVLSVLDIGQNVAFAGPATGAPASSTALPDPHLVWLNLRFPLTGGHFNIGFADLVLIVAVAENLRRRKASVALSVLPGVIGLGLGDGLTATLPANVPVIVAAFEQSLVPMLTAGYVLTELAVGQMASREQAPTEHPVR